MLSVHAQQILISELTEEVDFTELGRYICLFTGIRVGGLCALTWDDISLENNMIHIQKTMQCIQTPDGEKENSDYDCRTKELMLNPLYTYSRYTA